MSQKHQMHYTSGPISEGYTSTYFLKDHTSTTRKKQYVLNMHISFIHHATK